MMTMDNIRTNIWTKSKQCRGNEQFKDQTILEISLDKLELIQMEDKVKNVLVMIINLVIKYGDAKAMVRHLCKAVKLQQQHYKGNQPIKIVEWNCRSLRSKLP
jgi:SAM-dependent MidA family methyltransferase